MLVSEQSVPSRMNRIIETTTNTWNDCDHMVRAYCTFDERAVPPADDGV